MPVKSQLTPSGIIEWLRRVIILFSAASKGGRNFEDELLRHCWWCSYLWVEDLTKRRAGFFVGATSVSTVRSLAVTPVLFCQKQHPSTHHLSAPPVTAATRRWLCTSQALIHFIWYRQSGNECGSDTENSFTLFLSNLCRFWPTDSCRITAQLSLPLVWHNRGLASVSGMLHDPDTSAPPFLWHSWHLPRHRTFFFLPDLCLRSWRRWFGRVWYVKCGHLPEQDTELIYDTMSDIGTVMNDKKYDLAWSRPAVTEVKRP